MLFHRLFVIFFIISIVLCISDADRPSWCKTMEQKKNKRAFHQSQINKMNRYKPWKELRKFKKVEEEGKKLPFIKEHREGALIFSRVATSTLWLQISGNFLFVFIHLSCPLTHSAPSLSCLQLSLTHPQAVWKQKRSKGVGAHTYTARHTQTNTHQIKMTCLLITSLAELLPWFTTDFLAVNTEDSRLTFTGRTTLQHGSLSHTHTQT